MRWRPPNAHRSREEHVSQLCRALVVAPAARDRIIGNFESPVDLGLTSMLALHLTPRRAVRPVPASRPTRSRSRARSNTSNDPQAGRLPAWRSAVARRSAASHLMIHQLEIGWHDYAGRRITRLPQVAQSRHAHRLARKEHQSHAQNSSTQKMLCLHTRQCR